MEKFVLDYLSKIEGIKTRIKEIHWEEGTISGHELAGDVEELIAGFEDSIAEDMQGVFGEDILVKELEPVASKSDDQKSLLEELYNVTVEFYKQQEGDKFIGARSETENFLHEVNVKKYLVRKTIKEAKNSQSTLDESDNKHITESKLISMLAEEIVNSEKPSRKK